MANEGFSASTRFTAGECAILLSCAVALALAALLAGHAAMLGNDRSRLAAYTDRLFDRAVEIAAVTTQTLEQADVIGTPCSDADLGHLREVAFYSQLLRDIGRLRGNRLACSAVWGLQTGRIRDLPAPHLDLNGVRLWTNLPNPANAKVLNDMAAKGDTIVVTSPSAFVGFEPPAGSLVGAKVTSMDGRHVFRAFGAIDSLQTPPDGPWQALRGAVQIRRCNDRYLLCAVAGLPASGLMAAHPVLPIGLGSLGLLAGSGLGLALIGYRRRRTSLPMRLRRAVARHALRVHYQPLRALADGRLVGAESLARWRDEDGTWVPPDVFIPLAENLGLIGAVTRHIVRTALSEMRPRLCADDDFYLSLNVTAEDLLDADFHAYLDEQVAARGIQPGRVALEITERSTAEHADFSACVQSLRRRGYRFYIDDFGTGFSNLSSLASFPVDAVKIDRMFIQSIGTDSPVKSIIEPICEIARQLHVDLVVEGVETREQADYVSRLAPSAVGQGWLLGRPVPPGEFPAA